MSKKAIIVIGGGLGGLSTGIYAQMNGYETTIYEKNPVPGGLAILIYTLFPYYVKKFLKDLISQDLLFYLISAF